MANLREVRPIPPNAFLLKNLSQVCSRLRLEICEATEDRSIEGFY